MGRGVVAGLIVSAGVLAAVGARVSAQVTLADDIILAAQGKENAERARESSLGRTPGTRQSPYRRSPGSADVLLGIDPNRRIATRTRESPRPPDDAGLRHADSFHGDPAHEPGPGGEGLRLPVPLPGGPRGRFGDLPEGPASGAEVDDGPPGGLTLDAAVERLVRCNPDLRAKFMEIPQAEADVLTAGLRENPLLFYSSDSIPYGSYSSRRPGEISHGISVVLPFDYSGKRRARVAVAEREKGVLEAQYRNAVRLAIDDLAAAFVDALARGQSARASARDVALLDQVLSRVRSAPATGSAWEELVDDLTIEREIAAISAGEEQAGFVRAKRRLASLLALTPEEADALQLRGALRDPGPHAPPAETLIPVALGRRPDLAAYRIGVARAEAEFAQERAERFSDAYLLYTPFEYRDNSQVGEASATAWGAGLFVSAPLLNRNQGNLRRARLNIAQSRDEAAALERQVVGEVRQAVRDYAASYEGAERFQRVVAPASRRRSERARQRVRSGEIDVREFLSARRDDASLTRYHRDLLARHRRNALKINTAVGHRIMP